MTINISHQTSLTDDLIQKINSYVSFNRTYGADLKTNWTMLPHKEQQKVFVENLYRGISEGVIFFPRKKRWKNPDDACYLDAEGRKRKKNPWFNNNIYRIGSAEDWSTLIWGDTNDCYVCGNPMDGICDAAGKTTRSNAHCIGIQEIHLDIDILHEIDPYPQDLADRLISVVIGKLNKILPAPTMITLSGRGLTWIYRYRNLIDNSEKNPELICHDIVYRNWIHAMQELFPADFVEIDTHITDHARVLRHPGTLNTKAGRYASLLIANGPMYDAGDLWTRLPQKSKKERTSHTHDRFVKHAVCGKTGSTGDNLQDNNTIPFAPMKVRKAAAYRLAKMEQIPETVDLIDGSGRHDFIFVYYCHAKLIHTRAEAVKLAVDLNKRFTEPLTDAELYRQLERVDQHIERPEWKLHGDGLYIFSVEKMLDFLPLSVEAARKLGFLRSSDIKAACKKNQEECMRRDAEIAKLWLSGRSHRQIYDVISSKYTYISLSTVKRATKRLGLTSERNSDPDRVKIVERYKRKSEKRLPV